MKPLLLHGPALTSSRKKLLEIRQQFDSDNVVIFEKGASLPEILANLQTVSMFDDNRLVIVENPPDDSIDQLSIIKDRQVASSAYYQLSIILWFDHELKKLPEGWQVLFFPEAKEYPIFPLLDFLAAGKKEAYLELKKRSNDTQYVITMIFYLLRSLAVPPKNAPSFVKNKLEKQRNRFKEGDLEKLYRFVLETDFKIKSGLIELDQAEFLLVNRFIPE